MNFLARILASCLTKNKGQKKPKKWLIGDMLERPEDFMLTAYIENDELIVRVKRKGDKNVDS